MPMAMAECGKVLVGLKTTLVFATAPFGLHRVVGGASNTTGSRPTWTVAQQLRLSGLCGPGQWVQPIRFIVAEAAFRVTVPSPLTTKRSRVVP